MLNVTKHDPQRSSYQIKPEKNQYLASSSPNNQFATNVKSYNESKNAIAIIEELFLNIGHKLFYKGLMEKALYKICKLFMHFPKHMSSKDRLALCEINL